LNSFQLKSKYFVVCESIEPTTPSDNSVDPVDNPQLFETDTILNPKNLYTQGFPTSETDEVITLNQLFVSSTESLKCVDNSEILKNYETKESSEKTSLNMSIGKALSPPGIIIPKHGYYGLSEGDIPGQVARCDSDVSVNTILSEEHLLAEYVHDMSLEIYEQVRAGVLLISRLID